MSEFNIHSESVDVEEIMDQIRSRIREKRGIDYTEEQIREMANVKLEQFLEPGKVRSDLLEHYKRRGDKRNEELPPRPDLFEFDPDIIYRSSRGITGRLIHGIRRLLNPLLKLFFNPTPVVHALHLQGKINESLTAQFEHTSAKLAARSEFDALTYELLNNLVVEMTRLSIDMKNHKMRVESIASRLDFDERRAKALEEVVQYRNSSGTASGEKTVTGEPSNPERRRRRRRRPRRRPGVEPGIDAKTSESTATDADQSVSNTPDGSITTKTDGQQHDYDGESSISKPKTDNTGADSSDAASEKKHEGLGPKDNQTES